MNYARIRDIGEMLGKQGMASGAGLPALGLTAVRARRDYGIEHRQSTAGWTPRKP